jgi:hypothetical protein
LPTFPVAEIVAVPVDQAFGVSYAGKPVTRWCRGVLLVGELELKVEVLVLVGTRKCDVGSIHFAKTVGIRGSC